MLEIEARKQKRKSNILLAIIFSLIIGVPSSLFAQNYFGTNSYWNSESGNTKKGLYIEPFLNLPFDVSDFLKKYGNFELKSISKSDLIISRRANTALLDNSELLFQKVGVPIGKFESTERSLTMEDVNDIVLYETGLGSYFANDTSQIVEMSCEDVKQYVKDKDSRAIVSLECLDKTVAIFGIDGTSIFGSVEEGYMLERGENYFGDYKLKYEIWASYDDKWEVKEQLDFIRGFFDFAVFDETTVGQVVMTGVTAMGRTVLHKIEAKGPQYPIEKVANVIKNADVAHTSNEVSFLEGCTQEPHTMSFCSPMESIETLTLGGFDIVELTGNHNNDKGWQANLESMKLYEENGIQYVGGGENIEDANTIRYTKIGDHKVGWVGFNAPGPSYAWATETTAGAAEFFEDKLIRNVKEAKENADTVILVIQWRNENSSYPTAFQKESARIAIDNGADMVVGSQGHGTQKMEFYEDGIIYYALGNFMFDQMFSDKVRQGIVLRLNTINGEIKNIEMLPYEIEDFCQPNFVYNKRAEEIVDGVVKW